MAKQILIRLIALVAVFVAPLTVAGMARADLGGGADTGGSGVPADPIHTSGPGTSQPIPGNNGFIGGAIAGGGCGAAGIGANGDPMQCPVPAPTYTLVTARCGWDVGGSYGGPGLTVSQMATVARTSVPRSLTKFAAGDTSKQACANSMSMHVNVPTVGFGLFDLRLAGTQKSCSWRDWSDGRVEFAGCGGEYALPTHVYKLTQWCGGTVTDWVIRDFGLNGCQSQGMFACAPAGGVTFDGQPVQGMGSTLDDGVQRQVVWAATGVTGDVHITGEVTRFAVDPKGTPTTAGTSYPPEKVSTTHGGTPLAVTGPGTPLPGDVTSVWVGWQLASLPGAPSVLTRSVEFTGDYPARVSTVGGIDLLTGEVTLTSGVQTVHGTLTCTGTPLRIDVVRGRNIGHG